MAEDCILLEHASLLQKVCFRHYGWNENAYTFGYSQSYLHVKQLLPDTSPNLYRRPTGGGIISHTNDWTYSLSIPPSHKDYRTKPSEIYFKVHKCLSLALNIQGIKTNLMTCSNKSQNNTLKEMCFSNPQLFDVISLETGKKLAGAAMKRNQSGLLIQGSIDKTNLNVNWLNFYSDFKNILEQTLQTTLEINSFPDYPKRKDLYDYFNSIAWNQKR